MNKKSSTQLIFLLTIFVFVSKTFAQKQNNQWKYGYGGGIDFNFCPPRGTDGGSMSTNEGSASISNRRTGDLLFYTNGVTIWDKNNNPMPNGKNLTGGSTSLSSTSAATIIPAVNDTNLFYIVTIDEQFSDKGLRYSVLDMRLNGGLGDVVSTQKNILLYNTISEKIQVVPNAAKNGYWIISHDNSQSFVVFALTSAGINSTPIISLAGGSQGNGAGHLKVNRQFNKIAMGVVFGGEINLLNFNNTTGVVTNNLTWKSKLANPLIYGIEFSSDGSKLYAANLDKIVQFDISLNNATAISNSYYEVLSGGGFTYQPSSMQLGPNNKIYINNGGSIGCINSPNLSGASCDYENNVVTGLTGGGGYGLPQFVYYLDNDATNPISNAILNKDSCVNKAVQFSLLDSLSIVSVLWNFGDNLITTTNTSNLKSPLHVYSKPGKYNVKALIKTDCGDIEVTKEIEIIDCSPKICKASINTLDSCQQKLVQFSVKADSAIKSVNWFFGFDNTRPDNFSTNLKPSYAYPKAGKYTIQLITELSCGFDTATKEIEIIDCSPKICKASINTLDSCQQKLVQFSVKADSAIKSVNWFFGFDNTRPDNFSTNLNPSYAYPKAGKYTIQLITELSCGFDTATKEIEILDCSVDTTIIQTFLPNVFTPNNDLVNDVFKIVSNKNLEQFNLVVYNRWGQEIFNTNNYEQGWNGRYQDNDCQDGVYFYLISYSYKKKNYNTCGTVTLLR